MAKRIKGEWTASIHALAAETARTRGSVTFTGEERARQGQGLDPLVDPKEYGVTRMSLNLMVPQGRYFVLESGIAIPVKSDIDTTGSMGGNIEVAFSVLPKVQHLLVQGPNAVLRRYHVHIATGVVQDRHDEFPYQVSQFEPDNEIDHQMGLLDPERDGKDNTEDYQLGLFSTAYLTKCAIWQYGLKGYYFPMGDERGRDQLDELYDPNPRRWGDLLARVFGKSVYEKAFGSQERPQELPTTKEVAETLLEHWHAFFLQVKGHEHTMNWWSNLLGRERVIRLPRTEDIAEVQAVIIGLTEGVLDLQSAMDFLVHDARVGKPDAQKIIRAVANIPMGLQAAYENFSRIPMKGATFASKDDIWPVGVSTVPIEESSVEAVELNEDGDEINWEL